MESKENELDKVKAYVQIIKEDICVWCHKKKDLLPIPVPKTISEEEKLWYCHDCIVFSQLGYKEKLVHLEKIKTKDVQDPNTIDYYCLQATLKHFSVLEKAFEYKKNN